MNRDERWRQFWDKQAGSYDRQMGFWDRRFFADTRPWICSQASGATLEVAIGTGLNLPHYPTGARLTGVEWSPQMLEQARRRAVSLGRRIDLTIGDAQALRFADDEFDTVVCTFSLCAIPDERRAVDEMVRVLRPGGLLLLADHVEARPWLGRLLQRTLEVVTVPSAGEHWRRRPIRHVEALGLPIERHERFAAGVVERFAARKPA
ncbi:class I SAM-dependent methyltransferase [Cryptosporangium arvum]|uniref:Methylase involved in ubiquinone/menaquinone biosynthesis n=1 Tax=Cryptosporangium arvum DSM 44712 TaxID=927661 RepID=A0A010Z3I0_9ACTN|nr:class I SAM-dependent methyltransferase [Cryptosporangium arvum]EXG81958.1 methylase involved in ubiquinone/menaquinone biosynthesis [Cryptosporangium arvum DSM 44712]